MHKLLTLDDLVKFCEQNNFAKFNAKDSGYQICVQIPATFDENGMEDDGLFFGNVLVMHTGVNRNKSSLTEDAAKKAIKNLAYKPVLANFCEIDGVKDFTSHDFDVDENGEYIYYEKQVGCFTADKAYMEKDPDREDRMNIFAKVAIPREYTDAAEIIERKNGTKCSVELGVNELSYSAKDKVLMLEDVDVMGLTLLGKDPETGQDVQEGMENAHVQIEDFSIANNSLTFNAQIIDSIADAIVKRISNKADNSAQNLEEGGKDQVKFNELLEKYGKTVEDIDFEYEGLTDEELEEAFAKAFEEEDPSTSEDEVKPEEEPQDENFADDDPEETDPEETDPEEPEEEEVVIDDDTLPRKVTHSVTYGEVTKEFSVSLQDKIYALSTLVNDTYSETDNAWYDVTVYDDDKYVVMKDWWNDKAFKQSYKVKKDVYSLVGDRVAVFAQYLTEDEIKKLDDMRANYSSTVEKLAKYESEPDKMEILNSDDYANIAETAEFVELKKEENHFDMAVEDVRAKADELLLAYAKGNKIEFAEKDEKKKTVGMKQFGQKSNKKPGRYGNLFKK